MKASESHTFRQHVKHSLHFTVSEELKLTRTKLVEAGSQNENMIGNSNILCFVFLFFFYLYFLSIVKTIFQNQPNFKTMGEKRQAICHANVIWKHKKAWSDSQVQFLPRDFGFVFVYVVKKLLYLGAADCRHCKCFIIHQASIPNKWNKACFSFLFYLYHSPQKTKGEKWKMNKTAPDAQAATHTSATCTGHTHCCQAWFL